MSSIQRARKGCRICGEWREDSETGYLINACKCKGILAFVHETCLTKYLEMSLFESCDFCKFQYCMEKKPKNVFDWLREAEEERNDTIVIIIFSSLTIYFLVVGSVVNYFTVAKSNFLLSCFLWLLIVFWFLAITLFNTFYILRQRVVYSSWKQAHYHIKVRPNPESIIDKIPRQPLKPKDTSLPELKRRKDDKTLKSVSNSTVTGSTGMSDSSTGTSNNSTQTSTSNSSSSGKSTETTNSSNDARNKKDN